MQRLRDEIELLEQAGKNSQLGPPESIVVLPERQPKDPTKSLVHSNKGIQNIVDQARKG